MESFMRAVQADDTPHISPQRFGQRLEIGMPRLAQLARVHRTTIYKAPATEQLQSYLRNVIKVLAAATLYSGNLTRAIYWYRNQPIDILDFKTPEELVAEGRVDQLLRYIATLEAGTG
jgi:hypothetical protein